MAAVGSLGDEDRGRLGRQTLPQGLVTQRPTRLDKERRDCCVGTTSLKVFSVEFAEGLSQCSLVKGKSGLKKAQAKAKIIYVHILSTPRFSKPSRPDCALGNSHHPPLLLSSRSVSWDVIPATRAEPAPAEVTCHLLITVPAARPSPRSPPLPASDPAALMRGRLPRVLPLCSGALRVSFLGPLLPRASYKDRPRSIASCFVCTLQRLRFFVFCFFANCRFVASTSKKITTLQRLR